MRGFFERDKSRSRKKRAGPINADATKSDGAMDPIDGSHRL
jgi:hypothetical protein